MTLSFSASPTPSVSASVTPLPPFHVSLKVYNSAGEEVGVLAENLQVYQQPQKLTLLNSDFNPDQNGVGQLLINGPGTVMVWDGSDSSGQIVQSGIYYISMQSTDSFGKTTTWSKAMTVLRTNQGVLVQVFNGAGELVWSDKKPLGNAGNLRLSDTQFSPTDSGPGLKISYGTGASDFSYWNGLNSQGQAVASGTYVVQVTQDTETGKKIFAQSVTVLQPSATVFDQAVAWPNPAPAGTAAVTIQVTGLAAGSELWGDVYDLAGERVGSLETDPAGLRWNLSENSASGIYLTRINAKDGQGHQRSQAVKIAILR
jgi:flagellar hook assembly protein FlgD